jgi:hypothetical protein
VEVDPNGPQKCANNYVSKCVSGNPQIRTPFTKIEELFPGRDWLTGNFHHSDESSSNGGRVRRDRLLTYLVWTKFVGFQRFWTNDTASNRSGRTIPRPTVLDERYKADEITGMHEIAAQKKLTSMMSRRYLEKESI